MIGNKTVIYNHTQKGGIRPIEDAPLNRAGLFGDGVFETMIFTNGSIRFGPAHEERMHVGLKTLKIEPSSLSLRLLEEFMIKNFEKKNSLRIRWNVYRGGLGKYFPLDNRAVDMIMVQAAEPIPQIKDKAYISRSITVPPSPWSHCKTLNGLPYVMASIERVENNMDEVVLLSDKGFISETGTANIFWKKGEIYYTPSLSCNCIAGVARKKIMETLKANGLVVKEGEFTAKEIFGADQVFTSNVTGITYLARLEEIPFDTTALPLLEGLFV